MSFVATQGEERQEDQKSGRGTLCGQAAAKEGGQPSHREEA